jgi:hypothetical protein
LLQDKKKGFAAPVLVSITPAVFVTVPILVAPAKYCTVVTRFESITQA